MKNEKFYSKPQYKNSNNCILSEKVSFMFDSEISDWNENEQKIQVKMKKTI